MVAERLLPHNIEAEEAVVGSLLIDSDAITRVAAFLKPDDFYRDKNRWTYEACFSLYERTQAIDQVTVSHELERRETLEAVGGPAYLSHLVSTVPTSVHIEYYAQIVHRTSLMRRLIDAAGQIEAIGYDGAPEVEAAFGRAEEILFGLRHSQRHRDFVPLRDLLDRYLDETEYRLFEDRIIPTGYHAIDDILGGLRPSDMVVLAARPSLGKTSLALGFARNAAVEKGAHVALFSLEMSRDQLVQRLLASEANVDTQRLRLGGQTEAEEKRVMQATGVLSEAAIFVDDSPNLRMAEMKSKARRLHADQRVDLVIVDYMQLIRVDGRENRVQEVTEVSRSIKELARELDVPVVAVSQLSRAPMARSGAHRPQLSDLRESGAIEQDADVVMFIHSVSEEEWKELHPGEPYPKGVHDVIVEKHRNGPRGTVNLRFHPATVKFEDWRSEVPV